jgi:hypothetical protein
LMDSAQRAARSGRMGVAGNPARRPRPAARRR